MRFTGTSPATGCDVPRDGSSGAGRLLVGRSSTRVALSSSASRGTSGAASDLTERASPLAALPASIKNVGVLKTVGIVFPPHANYESDGTIAEGPSTSPDL